MLRHRAAGNERRKRKGLCMLPWGPRFNHERSYEVHNRSRTEPLIDSPTLPSYESFELTPVLHQPATSLPSQRNVRNNANTSFFFNTMHDILNQNQSTPIQELEHINQQHQTFLESENFETAPHFEPETFHSTASTIQEEDVINSSFNEDIDVSENSSLTNRNSMEEDQQSEAVVRERSRYEFMEWAWNYKQWIELYIDFGISSVLFQSMLVLLKSPYHCRTVKRNVIKYSKFKSTIYIVCRRHMLLCPRMEPFSEQYLNNLSLSCELCEHNRSSPDLTTFEYLPIKHRLLQWYESEESFQILTNYRKNKLVQRTTEHEAVYEDYFDGDLFQSIVDALGGKTATEYDLFLGVSSDGFQAFERGQYDCWPIVAINLNLHPSIRFLLKNLIPLGYIKGPSEPERLDTFFIPLKEELDKINDGNGINILCGDGIERSIRVHVLWITTDKAARVKLAGNCGHNGRCPCETCTIEGYWLPQSKHYYYPSKILNTSLETNQSQNGYTTLFKIDDLPKRTVDSIQTVWSKLDSTNTTISNAEKASITVRTGIKPKTAIYSILTIKPFTSFPHDSMHHIMNVTKDLLEIWKGENRHLSGLDERTNFPFVLTSLEWKRLDNELASFASGTSAELFGPIPRSTSFWKCYKASECRDFLLNYAVILFSDRLPDRYVKGVYYLSRIVELCCRTILTEQDVQDLKTFAIQFYEHFEQDYYGYDVKRVGIMKSTIHTFLHLHEYVKLYGPFPNFNQYWVERKIGSIKHNLNSTHLVSESMTEQAKLEEGFKLLFNCHFRTETNASNSHSEKKRTMVINGNVLSLSTFHKEFFNDSIHVAYRAKSLIRSYLINKGFNSSEVQHVLSRGQLYSHNQVEKYCNLSTVKIGAWKPSSQRLLKKRNNFYVSTEYYDGTNDSKATIYYGRIIKLLELTWRSNNHMLVLIDWATQIRTNQYNQVLSEGNIDSTFRYPTIEEFGVVKHLIGVVEHRCSGRGTKTYFIDPQLNSDYLLQVGRLSVDSVDRKLGYVL